MMQTLRMQSVPGSLPSFNQSISLTGSLDSNLSSEYSLSHSLFAETPLEALSKDTYLQLSKLLNSKKVLRSEEGYERDWRGIAALSKTKAFCDETSKNINDPISEVIKQWIEHDRKSATFANLELFLGKIDRWDVSDDIYENLVKDSESYRQKQSINGSVDTTDTTDTTDIPSAMGSDPKILTLQDVENAQKGLPPQIYDAYLLFVDSDIEYAAELKQKLEEYGLIICFGRHDCLGGILFPHVKLSQLIDERCRHLVVIFTKDFQDSSENTFLNKYILDYTQMRQIVNEQRKIIPLIYDRSIELPTKLGIYTRLYYDMKDSGFVNFWRSVADSLRSFSYISPIQKESIAYQSSNGSPNTGSKSLPTTPCDIPSISINGHAFDPEDDEIITKKQRRYIKRISLRHNSENRLDMEPVPSLRNAHSTSQINTCSYKMKNNSLSDISTTSISSDSKKKKKWPSKILKKCQDFLCNAFRQRN